MRGGGHRGAVGRVVLGGVSDGAQGAGVAVARVGHHALQGSQRVDCAAAVVGGGNGRLNRGQVVWGDAGDAYRLQLRERGRRATGRAGHDGLHRIGQGLDVFDAGHGRAALDVDHVAQQALLDRRVDAGHANGGVLRQGGLGVVVVQAVGALHDGGVGVDHGLQVGERGNGCAVNGGAVERAVDHLGRWLVAAAHAGDASIGVGAQLDGTGAVGLGRGLEGVEGGGDAQAQAGTGVAGVARSVGGDGGEGVAAVLRDAGFGDGQAEGAGQEVGALNRVDMGSDGVVRPGDGEGEAVAGQGAGGQGDLRLQAVGQLGGADAVDGLGNDDHRGGDGGEAAVAVLAGRGLIDGEALRSAGRADVANGIADQGDHAVVAVALGAQHVALGHGDGLRAGARGQGVLDVDAAVVGAGDGEDDDVASDGARRQGERDLQAVGDFGGADAITELGNADRGGGGGHGVDGDVAAERVGSAKFVGHSQAQGEAAVGGDEVQIGFGHREAEGVAARASDHDARVVAAIERGADRAAHGRIGAAAQDNGLRFFGGVDGVVAREPVQREGRGRGFDAQLVAADVGFCDAASADAHAHVVAVVGQGGKAADLAGVERPGFAAGVVSKARGGAADGGADRAAIEADDHGVAVFQRAVVAGSVEVAAGVEDFLRAAPERGLAVCRLQHIDGGHIGPRGVDAQAVGGGVAGDVLRGVGYLDADRVGVAMGQGYGVGIGQRHAPGVGGIGRAGLDGGTVGVAIEQDADRIACLGIGGAADDQRHGHGRSRAAFEGIEDADGAAGGDVVAGHAGDGQGRGLGVEGEGGLCGRVDGRVVGVFEGADDLVAAVGKGAAAAQQVGRERQRQAAAGHLLRAQGAGEGLGRAVGLEAERELEPGACCEHGGQGHGDLQAVGRLGGVDAVGRFGNGDRGAGVGQIDPVDQGLQLGQAGDLGSVVRSALNGGAQLSDECAVHVGQANGRQVGRAQGRGGHGAGGGLDDAVSDVGQRHEAGGGLDLAAGGVVDQVGEQAALVVRLQQRLQAQSLDLLGAQGCGVVVAAIGQVFDAAEHVDQRLDFGHRVSLVRANAAGVEHAAQQRHVARADVFNAGGQHGVERQWAGDGVVGAGGGGDLVDGAVDGVHQPLQRSQ